MPAASVPESETFPGPTPPPHQLCAPCTLANAALGKPKALQRAKAEEEKHGLSLLSASARGEPSHSHILLLGDSRTEETGGLQSMGGEDSEQSHSGTWQQGFIQNVILVF